MQHHQIIFLTFLSLGLFVTHLNGQVGINEENLPPATNAMLDIKSTTKGLLTPRMSTTQRLALTPSDGLTVYDTDTKGFWFHNGSSWQNMATVAGSVPWLTSGDSIYNANALNVGIGTSNPTSKLHVVGNTGISNDLSVGGGTSIANGLSVGGVGYFGGSSSYNSTEVSSSGVRVPVLFGSPPKSILFDWGYNNIKAGISYRPTSTVYGSDMFFHVWDNTSSFIFGRDDPFYDGGNYFGEWMRLKNGNLGIGTATPDAKLHVAGRMKMVDGNQASGKVLTSDADGLASWQNVPAPVSSGWTAAGFDIYNSSLTAGRVGIGTAVPGFPLNFASNSGDKISLWGNSGFHYGFGIQSGLLQIHTDGADSNIVFGFGQSASFTERARIINSGEYGMTIKGRLQINTGTQSAGVWLTDNANTANAAFIGMAADDKVGFYGATGSGWGLAMNTSNGNLGLGNLNPNNKLSFAPSLEKKISLYPGGTGDVGMSVSGNQLNLYADSVNGRVAFGWDDYAAGFDRVAYVQRTGNQKLVVDGYIWASGYAQPSDVRYKKNIGNLSNALNNILHLRGVSYDYKTTEFPDLHFSGSSGEFVLIFDER